MLTILNSNLIRLFQWAMLLLVYMVTPTTWAAPTASFTTSVNPSGPPYMVFLNAIKSSPWQGQGNNIIAKLKWSDSENGDIIQEINTTTSFATAGTYSITLTVWDVAGNSDTLTKSVTVGNVRPVAPTPVTPPVTQPSNDFSSPTPRFNIVRTDGLTVYVNASASIPGNIRGSITSYNYYVGNNLHHTATTPITSFTLDQAGTYKISLYVTDSNGNPSTTPFQQTVDVQSAQSNFQVTATLKANFKILRIIGCNVSVNASSSEGNITDYKYSWQQIGSITELGNFTRESAYVDIPLPQPGNYTISLKVFDGNGNSSTNTHSVQNVTIDASCSSTEDSTQLNQGSSFGNLIYGDPNTTVTNDDFTIMVTASIGSDINAFEPLTLEAISAESFVVGNDSSVDINATIVPSPEHENVYIVIVLGWDDQEGPTDWGKVKWYYKVLPKDILNDGWKRFTPELSDLANLSIPQYIMARSGEQSHSINVFTGQLLPPEIEDFGTARRVHFVVGYTPNNDLYLLSQPITLKIPGL